MGLELARAYVTVGAETSGAVNSFSSLRSSVENDLGAINQAASGMSNGIASAMNDVRTSILGVVGLVANMGKSFIQQGLDAAVSFEQIQISFDTMLGSAEETQKVLANLTDFAAKTPFEMPEILQAARGLIQFGERGDDMMETLRLLGNAASGTSSDFGMIALIFNQIRGVGKLLTQDFRQLSTRGVLSLQDIATHFKVTTAEAEKMISTGKVSFTDLRDIMKTLSGEGGRFENLMEKQSHSLGGLKSTFNDAVNILKRTIAIPLAEWTKPFLVMMIKVTEQFSAFINLFPELSGGAALGAVAMSSLTTAILGANLAMRLFGISWRNVMIGTGIGVGIVVLGAALGALIGPIQTLIKYIWSLKPVQDAVAATSAKLAEAWDRMKMAVANVWAAVQPLIDKFLDMIGIDFSSLPGSIGDALASAITFVGDFVLQVAVFAQNVTENWETAWDLVVTSAATAVTYVEDVFSSLASNITDVSVATWTGFSDAMIVGFDAAYKIMKAYGAFVMAELNVIPPLTSAVLNAMVQYWYAGLQAIGMMWEPFTKISSAVFQTVNAGFVQLVKTIGTNLGVSISIWAKMFEILPTLVKATFYRIAGGMAETINQISRMPELLKTIAMGGDTTKLVSGMMKQVQESMDKSWDYAGGNEAIDRAIKLHLKGMEIVGAEAAKIPGAMADAWTEAGGTKALTDMGDAVDASLTNAYDRMVAQFKRPELVDALKAVGDTGAGLLNSLGDGATDVASAFSDAFGGIDLKNLFEASSLTRMLADKATGLFGDLMGLTPTELPKNKNDKKKNGEDKKKEGEEGAAGKKWDDTRMGFAEYGKKIQDMITKGGNEAAAETTATEVVKHTDILTGIKEELAKVGASIGDFISGVVSGEAKLDMGGAAGSIGAGISGMTNTISDGLYSFGGLMQDVMGKAKDAIGSKEPIEKESKVKEIKDKLMAELAEKRGIEATSAQQARSRLMEELAEKRGIEATSAQQARSRLMEELAEKRGEKKTTPDKEGTADKEAPKHTDLLKSVVDELKKTNEKPKASVLS